MTPASLRTTLRRAISSQLGNPTGIMGGVVARQLNKINRGSIQAAVTALHVQDAQSVADIGFGGGIGLDLLLAAVPDGGHVHGVEPSASMINRARKAHTAQIAAGRLTLHQAVMQHLPFRDGELDGWISLNTIYFIDDLASATAELRRVTALTGRGVLGVADPDWMRRQSFAQHGFTIRPIADLIATLARAGFSVQRRTIGDTDTAEPYNLLICDEAT
jgi:ubiquinone/menaquinone biosynthesis C-methylase UbiE